MTVILCTDDRGGMLFNRRRVSRDATVYEDILKMAGEKKILIRSFSRELFPENRITLCEELLSAGESDDYCFVEDLDITPYLSGISRIILYRWGRTYPFDFAFDDSVLKVFSPVETEKIVGTSHPEITKEVYEK